jgi:hypothetical protein
VTNVPDTDALGYIAAGDAEEVFVLGGNSFPEIGRDGITLSLAEIEAQTGKTFAS